jgi:ATPase family associated with various cellular activities (AAA)
MYVNEHPSNSKFLYASEGCFTPDGMQQHCAVLESEIKWLTEVIALRFPKTGDSYTYNEEADWRIVPPPDLLNKKGPYPALVNHFKLNSEERLLLILVISRQINPNALDTFSEIAVLTPGLFRQTGCFLTTPNMSLVISLNTALTLIAGNSITLRQLAMNQLVHNGKLEFEQIIEFQLPPNYSYQLGDGEKTPVIAREYAMFLQSGKPPRPDFGEGFPAQLISTALSWDHLIVPEPTMNEVHLAMRWMSHGSQLIERSGGTVNKSFPILFFGPPGTGKSLTAKLIGKEFGKLVFRIDLSMMVSKYIGETEKNLSRLFKRAEGKDWILFFDEADALFGKRTQVSDARDKWANLEMSYLLQRIEEYDGLCILASNLRDNIDGAMLRRFQFTICFPRPTEKQREELWRKLLPQGYCYENIDFKKVSQQDLTGSNIANILKQSALAAESQNRTVLSNTEIVRFIELELMKESRTIKQMR